MVDIIAPVTDYISDSILTIRGDLLKRGPADTERFPRGTAKHILRVVPSGLDLEYIALAVSMFENEYSADNPATVVLPAGGIEVIELDMGTVNLGDRLLVNAILACIKGATAGNIDYNIRKKSGTAVLQSMRARVNLQLTWYQEASLISRKLISGIFRVITPGTLILHSWGISAGSDSTCSASEAELYVSQIM